jgi:hypothetical protein
VPETTHDILVALNKMLAANDRLDLAIDATRKHWDPHAARCWIDMISEPTKLLADHRINSDK